MAKSVRDANLEDEELCKEAQKFSDMYFDVLDRKREKVSFLYTSSTQSNLVYNGNQVEGVDNICKFMMAYPSTQHRIQSLDAQRLPACLTGELANGIILQVAGTIVVNDADPRAFTRNMVLCIEDNKYKIKSDRFRYID